MTTSSSLSPLEVTAARKEQIRRTICDFQEHERVSGTSCMHDDFYSLLRYILKESSKLQDSLVDLLPTGWFDNERKSDKDKDKNEEKEYTICRGVKDDKFSGNFEDEEEWARLAGGEVEIDTLNAFLKFWSGPLCRLSPYSPAFLVLSHIEEKWEQVSKPLLWAFCSAYWKHNYPPLKRSWIIPIVSRTAVEDLEAFRDTDICHKLTRRLQRGKLAPFDASIALAELLQVSLPEEFVDEELGSLHRVLSEAMDSRTTDRTIDMINAALAALETSQGCHCD